MTNVLTKLSRHSLALVLLPIIFVPVIFYSSSLSMVRVWIVNETFTHGFLVFPLTFWLVWQKRSQLIKIQPKPEPRAFILLLMFLAVWFVGAVVGVEIVQQFSMISIILTVVWITAGRQVMSCVLFPLMFLYFAVPFGQVFIPILMQYTANFTVALIKIVGVPIYQDGLSFTLPTGSWSVVEECSGVRYLIASLFLGVFYAYINYSSVKKRFIFILMALLLPILGNGLRAFGIVMIGHYSGMELAVGVDHLVYGWVFFGVIIFLLFYAGSFWWDTASTAVDVIEKQQVSLDEEKSISSLTALLIALSLIISLSAFSEYLEYEKQKIKDPVSFELAEHYSSWQFDAERSLNWQPIFVNPDAVVSRVYASKKNIVQLDIAYYQAQRRGAEAISTSNKLTNPYSGKWKLISRASVSDNENQFAESELKYLSQKLLIWRWYRVGEYETSSPYFAKVLEVYSLVFDGRSDISIFSIATPFKESRQITRQNLSDFRKASVQNVNKNIEGIRNDQ